MSVIYVQWHQGLELWLGRFIRSMSAAKRLSLFINDILTGISTSLLRTQNENFQVYEQNLKKDLLLSACINRVCSLIWTDYVYGLMLNINADHMFYNIPTTRNVWKFKLFKRGILIFEITLVLDILYVTLRSMQCCLTA